MATARSYAVIGVTLLPASIDKGRCGAQRGAYGA